jgi:hypothetical protein
VPNDKHRRQAAQAWPLLTACAGRRETLAYGEIGKLLGVTVNNVKHPLMLIAAQCKRSNLPPLAIVVVDKDTKLPNEEFKEWYAGDFEEGFKQVCDFDWGPARNPFSVFL